MIKNLVPFSQSFQVRMNRIHEFGFSELIQKIMHEQTKWRKVFDGGIGDELKSSFNEFHSMRFDAEEDFAVIYMIGTPHQYARDILTSVFVIELSLDNIVFVSWFYGDERKFRIKSRFKNVTGLVSVIEEKLKEFLPL